MTMSSDTKLVLASLVAIILSGGAFSLKFLNIKTQTTKLKSKLKEVGYEILDSKYSNEEWAKLLTAYQDTPNKEEIFGRLVNIEELKETCEATFKKDDEKDYRLVRRWCVKEEKMSDMLKRNNYELIVASNQVGGKEKWQKKVELLKQDKNNEMGLTFGNGKDVEVLEAACKEFQIISLKTHDSDGYEDRYIKSSKWCSESSIKNA